jgi:4-methyl-5(b-hydroxyethyl)-thiazole monophosphate biosynthesis
VQATAHPAFVDKFPAEVSAVDANVVVNGRVVTGRGPAPAMEFALALVEQLYGKDKVDEIAKPMVREHETRLTMNRRNKVE